MGILHKMSWLFVTLIWDLHLLSLAWVRTWHSRIFGYSTHVPEPIPKASQWKVLSRRLRIS
jgi:hypothetical protein